MRTFLKAIVLVPIAVIAIAFAVANREVVSISFDPFSASAPAFALVAPLFLVIFILLMAGVVIGGAASWLGQSRYRRTARRSQIEADDLRDEVERLRTELAVQARQFSERMDRPSVPTSQVPALAAYEA
ncbi:MAG TPA: LapA family protein [Lichenihabitans sp.]|jgi:uncharacterized integral membrane protein|nr:LapA family protein [Lichenihabitans sp.]